MGLKTHHSWQWPLRALPGYVLASRSETRPAHQKAREVGPGQSERGPGRRQGMARDANGSRDRDRGRQRKAAELHSRTLRTAQAGG